MLDNLVESRNHSREQKTLGSFMLTTSIVVFGVLTAGMIYSLFSQTVVLGADNLEISTLIAPVQFEIKPQPVEESKIQRPDIKTSAETKIPSRRMSIQRMEETPVEVPKTVAVTPSDLKARPNSTFIIASNDFDPDDGSSGRKDRSSGNGTGLVNNIDKSEKLSKATQIEQPPLVQKQLTVVVPKVVSGGVVNSQALDLVKPVYSAVVRNLGLKGEVKVQVMIDENGRVISASAVSGHVLLRSSAVSAARASRFTPATLSKQPVKVSGFIVYNFS